MIQIDFSYLVSILVPPRQRRTELILYIMCIIKPISQLHSAFQEFYQRKKFELTWNGQVCMLEELLNQEFDSQLTRIYITDESTFEQKYIFLKSENNENTYVFVNASDINSPFYEDTYIFTNGEEFNGFIIHVPISLTFNLDYFNFLVNKYKLPTIQYSIKYE